MTARSTSFLWFNDAGALRALWRVMLFLLATTVGIVLAAGIVGPMAAVVFRAAGLSGVTSAYFVEMVGVLAATVFMVRVVDRQPWGSVWMGRAAARPQLLAKGFAIGALAIGVPILVLVAMHWVRETSAPAGSWIASAMRVSVLLLPAALLEELMTRGYLLAVLRDAWGWPWAIAATSVGFGLLHLANGGASVESVTLVTLAGVFLAAVVYATRSLYAAWLAHFAWNWTMAVLFHTAVSGLPMESPNYRYVDAGPAWVTGGTWGPEGGVLAGLGMCGGIVYLFARAGARRRRPDDQ